MSNQNTHHYYLIVNHKPKHMKKIILILIVALSFTACKKENQCYLVDKDGKNIGSHHDKYFEYKQKGITTINGITYRFGDLDLTEVCP